MRDVFGLYLSRGTSAYRHWPVGAGSSGAWVKAARTIRFTR
jgi:hypothetical protein